MGKPIMTDKQVNIAKNKRRIQLEPLDKFYHYGLVYGFLAMAFCPLIFDYIHFAGRIKNSHYVTVDDLTLEIGALTIAAILWLRLRYILSLREIRTDKDTARLREILVNTASSNKWRIEYNNKKYFTIIISKILSTEQITIIFEENKILIGSVNLINSFGALIKFKRNKKIIEDEILASP